MVVSGHERDGRGHTSLARARFATVQTRLLVYSLLVCFRRLLGGDRERG